MFYHRLDSSAILTASREINSAGVSDLALAGNSAIQRVILFPISKTLLHGLSAAVLLKSLDLISAEPFRDDDSST